MGERKLLIAGEDAGLTEADRVLLREHGFDVVIVADVTALRPLDADQDSWMLDCAVRAIRECNITCKAKFGRYVAWELLRRRGGQNV